MTKELQDLVWSILPKEFKEEVKKEYKHQISIDNEQAYWMLERIFGKRNFTSDAEGEEMLTVSRKRVQDEFNSVKIIASEKICSKVLAGAADMYLKTLERLFGSKCLPDGACIVASNGASNVASSEPKPTEPKFKLGDKVCFNNQIGRIVKCDSKDSTSYVEFSGQRTYAVWIATNALEPYTEPTEKNPKESDETFAFNEPPATKSDDFDHIIRDGFRNHNRLHIAAMVMQGLLANRDWMKEKQFYAHTHSEDDPDKAACILIKDIAEDAMEFADALITECKQTDN